MNRDDLIDKLCGSWKYAALRVLLLIAIMAMLFSIGAAFMLGQTARYRHDGKYQLPDPQVTPGAIDPEIVADLSGAHRTVDGAEANICAKGFTTKAFRHTDESLKKKVCEEYGSDTGCPDAEHGEIDHLIPLEIGGRDVIQNLWWQRAPAYRIKDYKVEDKLKKLVCSGKITLSNAQSCIRSDWVRCQTIIEAIR